jgi:hypothetical protein
MNCKVFQNRIACVGQTGHDPPVTNNADILLIPLWGVHRRSQWPRDVRLRSAAAWLLGSRVRIPLGAWMFVSRVSMLCCPVQVEVSATGWSLVQRSPTVCLYVWSRNPEREVKGPSWTISACGWMNEWMNEWMRCVHECTCNYNLFVYGFLLVSRVAQSVQCLATGWTTGRARFDPRQKWRNFSSSLCVQTGSEAHPASCTMDTGGSFPWG